MTLFILSLIALVFAAPSLEERNEQLTLTNRVLTNALKELTIKTENAVGNSDLADCMANSMNGACAGGLSLTVMNRPREVQNGGCWYPNGRMALATHTCTLEWACIVDFARDSSNSLEKCFTAVLDKVFYLDDCWKGRDMPDPALYDSIKINGLDDCDKDSTLVVVKKGEEVWKEVHSAYEPDPNKYKSIEGIKSPFHTV